MILPTGKNLACEATKTTHNQKSVSTNNNRQMALQPVLALPRPAHAHRPDPFGLMAMVNNVANKNKAIYPVMTQEMPRGFTPPGRETWTL